MGKDSRNNNLKEQERLKAIGSYLRQVRIEKGISLEQVASKTLISHRLLKAIEEGKREELPELFYTRALLKKFASSMGIKRIDLTSLTETPADLPSNSTVSETRWSLPNFQIRSFHLYLIYIFVICVSVTGITTLIERPIIINKIQVEKQIPIESPVTIRSPNPKQPTTLVSQSYLPQSAVVNITLRDKCWLKVVVDGKTEFEGTLPKGTNRTWTGKKQVTVRAGNAGGVFITFNDEQEKLLGKPGEVGEVTYTVN